MNASAIPARRIAAYAAGEFGPGKIATNADAAKAGWSILILGLFHIGYPPDQNEAEIFFNDLSIIDGGDYKAGPEWPAAIASLKQNSPIKEIYASIGGGEPVVDFATIRKIYEKNGNSFEGTLLKKNLEVFCDNFKMIDGIDMDCEDADDPDDPGDLASFVAFCEMLIDMGFGITFCPYKSWRKSFWVDALQRLEQSHKGAVKWWNLQCYDGGDGNDPKDWATAITGAMPEFSTDGFILASDWARFYDKDRQSWGGDCPQAVQTKISPFAAQACVGGAFIWSMDAILHWGANTKGCGKAVGVADYITAGRDALQPVTPKR